MTAPDLTLAADVLDHIESWLADCGTPLTTGQAAVFAAGRAQIERNQQQVDAAEVYLRRLEATNPSQSVRDEIAKIRAEKRAA